MRKVLFSVFMLCICGLLSAAVVGSSKLKRQDRLFLPEKIYAVPGVECNIYFKNIFLTINHDNYVFDVDCEAGRNDLKRWRYVPTEKDGGKKIPLTLKVYDEDGLVAERSTMVCVAPADAGKDRKINILQIGDSLTNYTIHSAQLYKYCQAPGNPKLTMVGTRYFNPRGEKLPTEVKHEGYAGWTWNRFITLFGEKKSSKFLFKKDGKIVISPADYLKKYNLPTPDVITFQLGVNDISNIVVENREEKVRKILADADTFITAFKKDIPNAIIGVAFINAP